MKVINFKVNYTKRGDGMFIGRENELKLMNDLYKQNSFQLFVLYGRRRVGKTTFLNEFCKDKETIFYSAAKSNNTVNLQKFSEQVFSHYGEENLSPFSSWEKAIKYIDDRQKDSQLVLVIDEFPYIAEKNETILSDLQHLVDHKLKDGRLFIILCGSYVSFMEKEVLGKKSPIFGRRTGQLQMKPFDYKTSALFFSERSNEEKLMLYGAMGGTPLYLAQIKKDLSFKDNIISAFLTPSGYLYEEPLYLIKEEINEPGVYNAIIEAIAGGYTKSNEIATKTGEAAAKCLKYISTLTGMGLVYKETPFGEKESARKTIYSVSDQLFRFWYRYVFSNKTLLETGAQEIVWNRRIEPDYSNYMGFVFEKICREYLLMKNSKGELPVLFTKIGRWWGTDSRTKQQTEIDIVAQDGNDYLICECKWRNEPLDVTVLNGLKEKADVFSKQRSSTYYVLFSKSGFTDGVKNMAAEEKNIILVGIDDMF